MLLAVLLCLRYFHSVSISSFSDFHRAPGNDHFFSANTAVIKQMSNHETHQWTVHHSSSMSRLTNYILLVYSTNTDCSTTKFMKLGESQNCFHKHIYCVSCDEFCQVQYIIVIESVTVLSSTCCSVFLDTCTIMHKVFVFFHYCINVTVIH